jgi:D-alanine transaminase
MSVTDPISYVNGTFVPLSQAKVGIEDRAVLFADSVYEVVLVARGQLIDLAGHMARLDRSVTELRFPTIDLSTVSAVLERLVAENAIAQGMVYVQISRGESPRALMPVEHPKPSVFAFARALTMPRTIADTRPVAATTVQDLRWGRCDIKTTALVPPTLAQLEARSAGFDQVLFVDEQNNVTEGSASNAWIVRDGVLITREPGPKVLAGVTRTRLIALARSLQLKVVERAFSADEALKADEAFLTSATALIVPISRINLVQLKAPGPVTSRLFDAYRQFAFGN